MIFIEIEAAPQHDIDIEKIVFSDRTIDEKLAMHIVMLNEEKAEHMQGVISAIIRGYETEISQHIDLALDKNTIIIRGNLVNAISLISETAVISKHLTSSIENEMERNLSLQRAIGSTKNFVSPEPDSQRKRSDTAEILDLLLAKQTSYVETLSSLDSSSLKIALKQLIKVLAEKGVRFEDVLAEGGKDIKARTGIKRYRSLQ